MTHVAHWPKRYTVGNYRKLYPMLFEYWLNVDSSRQQNSIYSRILDYIKEGKTVSDFEMFKKFKVGVNEMKQAIYQAQDNEEWINSTTDADNNTTYVYLGESDEMPEGYGGPIRRTRSKD